MYKQSKQLLSFYCSPNPKNFSACDASFDDARYVMLGVPYDRTSSYRPGSRFAPTHIREASQNIETYSFRTNIDLEEVKIYDLGDLNVVISLEETLRRLEIVVAEIVKADKIPIVIGGEHTITAGTVNPLKDNPAIMVFDAHLDFREEFMGTKFSHATFLKRLSDNLGADKIILIGTRAACNEEIRSAKEKELYYITTHEVQNNKNKIIEKIKSRILNFGSVYISIDMDVLDPAYAPAVGNPEGLGLDSRDLIDIIYGACDKSIIGLDLVEVSPNYDNGATAILSAKIISEIICLIEKKRQKTAINE